MSSACRFHLALAVGAGVLAATPGISTATPVDPEILERIGPRVVNPGRNKKNLVEMGRKLFFDETFDGNGRTCGTCHPATNNFTIDPAFIATLPPDDPLFVHEFNPALAGLEDAFLLRNHALILENLDGFHRPGVMRSVPHNLALPTSMRVEPGDLTPPGADKDQVHALGWSGDGAPGTGSLREFSVGAIVQHLPKTLNRVPDVDFRLPTDLELDALEAFMLSVGRREDIDLAAMTFTDPTVQRGKLLFNNEDGTLSRGCSGCHANAGANNSDGFNRTQNTGAAVFPGAPATGDGGFGMEPAFTRDELPGITSYGDGRMNVPPLIEAADTPPFFHNNLAETLEDAVRFYTTDTFANSPSGDQRPLRLQDDDVIAIGAMLRTVNARENIRNSNVLSKTAQSSVPPLARAKIAEVIAETEDAIEVLTQGPSPANGPLNLYPEAVLLLEQALDLERQALRTTPPPRRNALLGEASALKGQASDMMIE